MKAHILSTVLLTVLAAASAGPGPTTQPMKEANPEAVAKTRLLAYGNAVDFACHAVRGIQESFASGHTAQTSAVRWKAVAVGEMQVLNAYGARRAAVESLAPFTVETRERALDQLQRSGSLDELLFKCHAALSDAVRTAQELDVAEAARASAAAAGRQQAVAHSSITTKGNDGKADSPNRR
jgi:hypothetical protein